jgi:hypothetical protein
MAAQTMATLHTYNVDSSLVGYMGYGSGDFNGHMMIVSMGEISTHLTNTALHEFQNPSAS